MAKPKNTFFKLTLVLIIAYTVVYVVSASTPYINPTLWKPLTFFALIFPYLLIGMLAVCIVAFFVVKKYGWLFVVFLFFGYKNIFSVNGLHFSKPFNIKKEPNTVRLLSWNVNDFITSQRNLDTPNNVRRKMLRFVDSMQADILCFQDFKNYEENAGFFSNIKYLTDTLHYTYHYFSIDNPYDHTGLSNAYGTIIFSKFPIVDSNRTAYNWPHFPEHLVQTTIDVKGKKVNIFNTHLRSMQLKSNTKDPNIDYSFVQDDTTIIFNKDKIHKLRYYDSIHVQQAFVIKQQLNASKYPFIFCADLNAVPSSFVYHHIANDLSDAFLQKGSGWGLTYPNLASNIRIDVLLHSNSLKTVQYYCPAFVASDHYPIVADIILE